MRCFFENYILASSTVRVFAQPNKDKHFSMSNLQNRMSTDCSKLSLNIVHNLDIYKRRAEGKKTLHRDELSKELLNIMRNCSARITFNRYLRRDYVR